MAIGELSSSIEKNRDRYISIGDKIWRMAETGFHEHQSAELLTKVFEDEGFEVVLGMTDMTDSELLENAKNGFERGCAKEPYKSPFPEGHKPPFHRLQEDKLQVFED